MKKQNEDLLVVIQDYKESVENLISKQVEILEEQERIHEGKIYKMKEELSHEKVCTILFYFNHIKLSFKPSLTQK